MISMFSYLFTYCSISLYTSWKKKKMIGGYSPSQKSVILTSSVFVLCPSVIFPGSCSQLFLLPFYLCYMADIFAQYLLVCQLCSGLLQPMFTWSGTIITISLFEPTEIISQSQTHICLKLFAMQLVFQVLKVKQIKCKSLSGVGVSSASFI